MIDIEILTAIFKELGYLDEVEQEEIKKADKNLSQPDFIEASEDSCDY